MRRKYLSASAINLFLTCSAAYFMKYEMGLGTDKTNDSYAFYGTLVHEICENIANKKYNNLEEAIKQYEDNYDNCGLLPEQFDKYYESGKQGIIKEWEFLNRKDIEIIGAEVNFNIKAFDYMLPFRGFIDLVYKDENGNLVVRDYKTSKPYTDQQLLHQMQPFIYAESCLQLFGELPRYFEFDFIRFDDKKTFVTNEEFMEFQRVRMQGIWKLIEEGVMEYKGDDFYCSNFCSSCSNCPKFNQGVED